MLTLYIHYIPLREGGKYYLTINTDEKTEVEQD